MSIAPDTHSQLNHLWQSVLGELELHISKANYQTWFMGTCLVSLEEGVALVAVPSAYIKNRIEIKYQPLLEKILTQKIEQNTKVVCRISNQDESFSPPPNGLFVGTQPTQAHNVDSIASPVQGASIDSSPLNPRYRFETFVVGNNNRLAHAACVAVAESPSEAYNPLFLYGGVGLGKTHLMHAIAQAVKEKHSEKKIVYVSSEFFTNELILSIRKNKTESFRKKYRTVDILLVDDVQFIAGKETTQEEFFHTFNSIYDAGKQIVLSSDRPPQAIPTLEARLSSRFSAGLIADIQAPDFENRLAILDMKVQALGLQITRGVLSYIAEKIDTNIRELEGALNRVVTHCRITNTIPSVDCAEEVLSPIHNSLQHKINATPKMVIERIADYCRVTYDDVVGIRRTKEIAEVRQISMYILRSCLNLSLNVIGGLFGGKDHTTVMYACDKVEKKISVDDDFKQFIHKIKNQVVN
jgi:chromosomal replication initiator protein